MEEIKTPMSVSGSPEQLAALKRAVDFYCLHSALITVENSKDWLIMVDWSVVVTEKLKDELFEKQNPK
jgi:hypothetical protein